MTDVDPVAVLAVLIVNPGGQLPPEYVKGEREDQARWAAHAVVDAIRTDPALAAAILRPPWHNPQLKSFARQVLGIPPEQPTKAPSSPASAPESVPGTPGHPDAALAQQERRARYEGVIAKVVGVPWRIADAVMAVADAELADHCEPSFSDELCDCRQCVMQDERDEARATIARLAADVETPDASDPGWPTNADAELDLTEECREPAACDCRACVVQAERDDARKLLRNRDVVVRALRTDLDDARATIERVKGALIDMGRQRDAAIDDVERLVAARDEARLGGSVFGAALDRIEALCDEAEREAARWECTVPVIGASSIRAALDAPTEPAPEDGSGLWLSTPMDDPPAVDRYEVDRLAAAKARIRDAAKRMGPADG